jgi:hypothetical protein
VARNVQRFLGSLLLLGLSSGAVVVHTAGSASAGALTASAAAAVPAVPSTSSTPAGRTEQEPTSADLDRQHAQVAALRAEAERRAAGVDDAQQALQGAAVLAGQALEDYATAVRTLQTQQQLEAQRQNILTQAQGSVDTSRRELGRWAREAYSTGTILGASATMTTLLQSDDAADVGTTLTVLRRIGRDRGRALTTMRTAQRQADRAADAAATASEAAAAAAVQASAAKQASEQAVNAQRRLLGVAESSLAQSNDDVSNAAAREAGLRAALLAQAPPPGSGSGATKDNRVTGPVGTCTGAAVEQYGNGLIPMSALCPLRSAAGHYLRADAAYAFDRLGQAYASRFGTAICITDSYRSYPAQVSVYARKPGLAAVPGTSNHGWGTAVDLCGGIQSFSSAEHQWMSENASLYGWFHPGWAQQNGSKPEPWHWEYGG